jgi:hypothetical protein
MMEALAKTLAFMNPEERQFFLREFDRDYRAVVNSPDTPESWGYAYDMSDVTAQRSLQIWRKSAK